MSIVCLLFFIYRLQWIMHTSTSNISNLFIDNFILFISISYSLIDQRGNKENVKIVWTNIKLRGKQTPKTTITNYLRCNNKPVAYSTTVFVWSLLMLGVGIMAQNERLRSAFSPSAFRPDGIPPEEAVGIPAASHLLLVSIQCFVTVDCVTGRASSPQKLLLQNP